MIPKYRRRAGIVLLVSIALIVALFLMRRVFTGEGGRQFNRLGIAVFVTLGCLYLYGCYTLIKAKGQNSALLLLAVPFICIPLIGAPLIAPLAIAIGAPIVFRREMLKSEGECGAGWSGEERITEVTTNRVQSLLFHMGNKHRNWRTL